jgi:SAM-dependent methyltransferase
MTREGEKSYYQRIGEAGRRHALDKPFSDDACGVYFFRLGALFSLLPPPPARVLDCGCGTGWLAHLLARRGYDVCGTDVAFDAIALASGNRPFTSGPAPRFLVADSEALPFADAFDALVFFDSLHHSLDERAALRSAHRALRSGGICVVLEPGRGHGAKSDAIDRTFDVTDKDMPPSRVTRLAKRVGFAATEVYPAAQHLGKALYGRAQLTGWQRALLRFRPFRHAAVQAILGWEKWHCGIAVLRKSGQATAP